MTSFTINFFDDETNIYRLQNTVFFYNMKNKIKSRNYGFC